MNLHTPVILLFLLTSLLSVNAALLDPQAIGTHGLTLNQSFEEVINAWYANGHVIRFVGDDLVVPWYDRDNACTTAELHRGASCNIGVVSEGHRYCLVTDELSQVGRAIGMSNDSIRVKQFINTVRAIKTQGSIPGWRVVVDEDQGTLDPAAAGVNGNADTASDATARIIIGLYDAANNPLIDPAVRADARGLADNISKDVVRYEYAHECHAVSLAEGEVCYWLKAGTKASLTGTDGSYTGYYPDAITAMLEACENTGNETYCMIAGQTWLNYKAAAYPSGTSIQEDGFRVPPGRSYRWDFTGTARAECTNTCNPDQWDDSDAVRAFFLGVALAKAQAMGKTSLFPELPAYMAAWQAKHLSTVSFPLQYHPEGTSSSNPQSGYKAQGLKAAALSAQDPIGYAAAVSLAIGHYNPQTRTWDNEACAGIYGKAFAVTALGIGLGRNPEAITEPATTPESNNLPKPENEAPAQNQDTPETDQELPQESREEAGVQVQTPGTQSLSQLPEETPGLSIGKLALALGAIGFCIMLFNTDPDLGTIVAVVIAVITIVSILS